MPTLFVFVPTFGKPRPPFDNVVQRAVVADLAAACPGAYAGGGGTPGHEVFGYRTPDEAAARDAVARAMAKHAPRVRYEVRVAGDGGCGVAFAVMKEFAPRRLMLQRGDGRPLGGFEEVQGVLRRAFPDVEFAWTASAPERLRALEAEGLPVTPAMRRRLAAMRSVLESVAEGPGYRVTFGLGDTEPVAALTATPLGDAVCLREGLAAVEADTGGTFGPCELEDQADH